MSAILQKQIQRKLDEKNLTVNALEKMAGLKRSAARNILDGYSKKPSAETLKSIADVLGCSVEDLMVPEDARLASMPAQSNVASKITHSWNEKLYVDSIKAISKKLADKKLDLKFEQVTQLAGEVYKYSLAKKTEKIDQDFINWLVNKNF
jgi:transcriptional regulator with XRE-family HTH domain